MDYIIHILPNMIQGLGVSAKIFLFTIVLSLPIGVLLAMVRISKVGLFRRLAAMYIYVMRGTPLMLQIMPAPLRGRLLFLSRQTADDLRSHRRHHAKEKTPCT